MYIHYSDTHIHIYIYGNRFSLFIRRTTYKIYIIDTFPLSRRYIQFFEYYYYTIFIYTLRGDMKTRDTIIKKRKRFIDSVKKPICKCMTVYEL